MAYAVWYDNASGYFEPFKIVEAQSAAAAIAKGRESGAGWSTEVLVTEATQTPNGFGNDPNVDRGTVWATSLADH